MPLRELLCRSILSLALLAPSLDAAAAPTPLPTEIAQDVSLLEAAQAGLLNLTAKGGVSGDQVAVDLEGARIPGAPVTITVRIEFFGTQANGSPWPPSKAGEFANAVEARIGMLTAPDGTPVAFRVEARVRSGTSPSGGAPGFHQIELRDVPAGQLSNFSVSRPLGVARTGEFGANEPVGRWAHEALHLAGLPDRYDPLAPSYVLNGTSYPLPAYSGDGSAASKAAWVENVLFPAVTVLEMQYGKGGEIKPGVPPGLENDIMADATNPNGVVVPADVQRFVDLAGVRARGNPGDLLLDKNEAAQNFAVGAPLDLFAPRGETVHVDGLYVYCIDPFEDVPDVGQVFDVLGSAAEQPEPQLAALQAVLEEIGRRQDLEDPAPPFGAQDAVWAIVDGEAFWLIDEALDILADAGVTFDEAFFSATPQFSNPNAAGAATSAVTRTGVLPPLEVETGPSPVPPEELDGPARLVAAAVSPGVATLGETTSLQLAVLVEGGSGELEIAVERRRGKKKWAPVGAAVSHPVNVGFTSLALAVPAKKGPYRARVSSGGETIEATFEVAKKKKRR